MKRTALKSAIPTMSAADQAAHEASSHVRSFLSPAGAAALSRLEQNTSGWFPAVADDDKRYPSQEDEALRRVREHGAALREGMAAWREWNAGAAA